MNMWPQFLVAIVIVAITVSGFVQHGKPVRKPTIDGYTIFWTSMWIALVLGAGGFWSVR